MREGRPGVLYRSDFLGRQAAAARSRKKSSAIRRPCRKLPGEGQHRIASKGDALSIWRWTRQLASRARPSPNHRPRPRADAQSRPRLSLTSHTALPSPPEHLSIRVVDAEML